MDSALALRNTGLEIIAVDDASTDGSQGILKQYRDRVQVVCLETNQGACAARNRGASLATGDYLVFLDGDDAFLPWAVDVYARIVQAKQPKIILATMSWFEGTLPAVLAGDAPQEIEIVDYSDYLRRDRPFGHSGSAIVVARQTFEDISGWLVGLFPAEDNDFALRLGISGRTILILAPSTILHRAHASNTINNIPSFLTAMENLLRRERLGGYPGGTGRKFERRALIGGMVFHWTKRASRTGLHWNTVKLLAGGSPMLLAAVTRRLGILMTGRQPCETIKI